MSRLQLISESFDYDMSRRIKAIVFSILFEYLSDKITECPDEH